MSKKKIAIIHFYPLEFFPPITNLLDYLYAKTTEFKVLVFTTHNNKKRKVYQQKNIKIRRHFYSLVTDNVLIRILKYGYFNSSTLLQLIVNKPHVIIYYETISSWPVYMYSKYFNNKCKIFIHFHEYASLEWYSKYMKLVKYYHKLEVNYLYSKAIWISQTNSYRLKMYLNDNPKINPKKLKVLPNYPPKNWKIENVSPSRKSEVINIIYIGSLSFEGTYIHEFCNWINSQQNVVFDVYSYNIHEDVKLFLNRINSENINFYEKGIDYQDIPDLLKKYDIGVILHKAYNENYKYNATNKLFEYLICDLDVWFPNEMLGCQEYSNSNTWPRVIGLDFNNLKRFKAELDFDRANLNYKPKHFYSEDAFEELYNSLSR